jgi:anaerobic magnesium-protoporphyrin IX monomethyl ester cyclase
MKIVFVQPKTFHTWEALNIGYLASYLKLHLGINDISFYSGFFDSDDEIITACSKADIIGFSVTSPQMKHALMLSTAIKKNNPHSWIVYGGVHASALPDDVLQNPVVDAVVIGEGELSFSAIVKGNRSRKIYTEYVKNLDELPFPDRLVIKQERNIQQAYNDNGIRIASIFSSRGCPYKCVFCASHCVWSRHVRFRSHENILDEFERLVKDLRIDFVKFSDDTFTIRKKLVQYFCEEKMRRKNKTPWGCNIRVDTDEETLKLMKAANCREVWIGVESGSQKILKQMRKGITVEQVKNIFQITKKIGFYRRAYMLLGMPEESKKDINCTENLVKIIEPDAVGFTILAPYPGTQFYNPLVHNNVDWSLVDEYNNDITKTNYLTNRELKLNQKRLVSLFSDRLVHRHQKISYDQSG